jgi:putative ABC transport system permease protein
VADRLTATNSSASGPEWLSRLWLDLRYAARALANKPGFTAVIVLTLALGIGANTAIFSVVRAVLLAPLPYKDSARIVRVYSANDAFKGFSMGIPLGDAAQIANEVHSLEGLTIYDAEDKNLTGEGEPQSVETARVANNLFDFLGTAPAKGRFFAAGEHTPGSDRVAVISDSLWRTRFGSDPRALGKSVRVDGEDYTVVGIARPGFAFPTLDTKIWMPLAPTPKEAADHDMHGHQALSRLRVGFTIQQATEELKDLAARIDKANPNEFKGWTMFAVNLQENTVERVRPALLILLGAVTFVLLIACANVANLLLTRGWQRHKEMALRAALGASRWTIARLLLTESVLLAVAGGILGLTLANWGVQAFQKLAPAGTPRIANVHPDWTMAAFALACSIVVGILFGLLPATQATRSDPNAALKETGASASPGRQRLRDTLAVLEIALALPLLVGSALLVRSFSSLIHSPIGFRTDHLMTMSMDLAENRYPEAQEEKRAWFARRVLEEVQAVAGVEGAAISSFVPFSGSMSITAGLRLEGEPESKLPAGNVKVDSVSPSYFQTMGIPVVRGRAFTAEDDAHSGKVVIVNETMAREFFRGGDPFATRIMEGGPKGLTYYTVVGVVRDVRSLNLAKPAGAELYYPAAQAPGWRVSLVVRAKQDPEKLVPAIRERIWTIDKDQPINNIQTVEAAVSKSVAEPKFRTVLIGTFAALGMVLALIGIYGVVSYAVSMRTREIGVRVAMGAEPNDVLGMVLGHGLALAAIGVAIGLAAAFVLTRFLASLLYGVTARDPWMFAIASVLLTAAALAACIVPATRAARVDPLVALRHE